MNIKFAFAVNHSNILEPKHFGEADKYLIYQYKNETLVKEQEIENKYKNLDEEVEHGSKKKGQAIINMLKKQNVSVLVTLQFGKNIRMINKHFIPVIINENTPEKVLEILQKHIKWIIDEINNKPKNYKLFTIKNSVMKSIISS